MYLALVRGGYPPIVIGPEHRSAYMDGLQAFQVVGDAQPDLMTGRLSASPEHHLTILERGRS